MEYYWWFIASFIFVILEIITPGFFFLWFGIGAITTGLLDLLGFNSLIPQIIVFVVISLALVAMSRTIFKNIFIKKSPGKEIITNVNVLLGKQGIVTTTINNDKSEGRILVEGQDWSARSANNDIIEQNMNVIILRFEGIKAIVEKI
ncbi:MAG: NfeD family protein [Candidatus Kapabacteria bacterium]|nr:NfeD family protein [Candidatus Kapabacteria bacterium]